MNITGWQSERSKESEGSAAAVSVGPLVEKSTLTASTEHSVLSVRRWFVIMLTLAGASLLVMTASIPFLMLAFWELGGRTPTPPALAAQVSGWIAVIVWCEAQ